MEHEIKNPSSEFQERSRLIELDLEAARIKHDWRMAQLIYERETSKILHEQILERGRIARAEQRKLLSEKEAFGVR